MEGFTLSKLFQVQKEIAIAGQSLTIRVLSDWESQECHRQAVLARVNVLRRLEDPNSDDYKINIFPLEAETDNAVGLRQLIAIFRREEISAQCDCDIPFDYIPFPENATREEETEVLRQRQEHEKDVAQRRSKLLSERMEAEYKRLEALERDKLLPMAKKAQTELCLQSAYIEELLAQKLSKCTVGEGDKPAFTPAQIRLLPDAVKNKIIAAYREVGDIDPLSLSLPSAMG